ncbi:MAG TPA: YebC/PmpR family DNA-binding transcriptional regulator, partial [Patescibacteria group bacterium]|nr:YebC/PmpR family DNA-binding transcriptional regulator [Patescibacteria group bacterium]
QVAFIIEAATDNKNRTVGEIKTVFSKNGGKVVPSGSVSFLFTYAGIIAFAIERYSVDALEEMAIESGADDFRVEDDLFLVITKPEKLQSVRTFFETKNILPESAELGYIPTQTISLSGEDLMRYENITGLLEDNIDIQTVWNNVH